MCNLSKICLQLMTCAICRNAIFDDANVVFLTTCNDHSTDGKDERRFASEASTERLPAERPASFSSSYDVLDKFSTNRNFFVWSFKNILLSTDRESAVCLRHIWCRHIASLQIAPRQFATHPIFSLSLFSLD